MASRSGNVTTTKVTTGGSITTRSVSSLAGATTDRAMKADESKRLRDAGDIIAAEARRIASGFSRRIPPATAVHGGVSGVFVRTEGHLAPNAAPFEFAERHPLFATGPRGTGRWKWWYKQPHRPYMEEASVRKLDAAAEAYADVIDDWAKRLGYH